MADQDRLPRKPSPQDPARMPRQKLKPAALVILLIVLALGWWLEKDKPDGAPETGTPAGKTNDAREGPANGTIEALFRQKRSKVWVESGGKIVHLLPDDRRPPRHQLCLVELTSGLTLKISHNVDLAPKLPWHKGDRLDFRGRYEWNEKGGVVHWTHADPGGRHAGGWLRLAGKTYR